MIDCFLGLFVKYVGTWIAWVQTQERVLPCE